MPQPPPSLRAQMFPSPARSNFHPGVQNVGGISKMNQRPSSQAKPKGSRRNISNPIKVSSEIKFADKAEALPNGEKQVFAVKVEVANCYPIMSNLQEPRYPFQPFRFDGTKCVWYTLIKTEKLYHAAADCVQSLANNAGMKFIDCHSGFTETIAVTEITLDYGWEGDKDDGEENNIE
eukprot:3118041-Rhodomonas_salina.1